MSESRHVANALQRRGQAISYLELKDDHHLEGERVRAEIAAAIEPFLATCLAPTICGQPTNDSAEGPRQVDAVIAWCAKTRRW